MIICRTVDEKRAVMKAIYDAGWAWIDAPRREALRCCVHYADADCIYLDGDAFYHGQSKRLLNHTPINSPRHLIEYCRTLGDQAPRAQ